MHCPVLVLKAKPCWKQLFMVTSVPVWKRVRRRNEGWNA